MAALTMPAFAPYHGHMPMSDKYQQISVEDLVNLSASDMTSHYHMMGVHPGHTLRPDLPQLDSGRQQASRPIWALLDHGVSARDLAFSVIHPPADHAVQRAVSTVLQLSAAPVPPKPQVGASNVAPDEVSLAAMEGFFRDSGARLELGSLQSPPPSPPVGHMRRLCSSDQFMLAAPEASATPISVTMLCEEPNCEHQPSFGFPGQSSRFCVAHKLAGTVACGETRPALLPSTSPALSDRYKPGLSLSGEDSDDSLLNVPSRKRLRTRTDSQSSMDSPPGPTGTLPRGPPGAFPLAPPTAAPGRRCLEPGCTRHPTFGREGERARSCAAHRQAGDVDVANRRCQHGECAKRPSYAVLGQRAQFCATHKKPGTVDVTNARCLHEGCEKQPRYAFEGERAKYCGAHRQDGMADVKHPRCEHPLCTKQPTFGYDGQKKARFCSVHRLEGTVDVKNPRCCHAGCTKRPRYSYEGTKARYCATHKLEGGVPDVSVRAVRSPRPQRPAEGDGYPAAPQQAFPPLRMPGPFLGGGQYFGSLPTLQNTLPPFRVQYMQPQTSVHFPPAPKPPVSEGISNADYEASAILMACKGLGGQS